MFGFSLRVLSLGLFCSTMFTLQDLHAQVNFTNSGQVTSDSPISGFLTDAAGDSVGYEISTVGALFFGWNGDADSEAGGVQADIGQNTTIDDWVFTFNFDNPIDQLTLSQTPFVTSGENAGGGLTIFSDAGSVSVDLGTPGLGADGVSNLASAVPVNGGDVIASLSPTSNDEADWSVQLNDLTTLTVFYQPIGATSADIGSEWFTISDAIVGPPATAIPEPSTLLSLGGILTALSLRRRRVG